MAKKWWLILLGCLALASLSPLAATSPDGLERVAEDNGFGQMAQAPPFRLIADYLFPGIHNEVLATTLAGLLGTLVVFGIAYGVARLLRARRAA